MSAVRVYLTLVSALCLGLGLMGLLWPERLAWLLLHSELPALALGEWRARTGGVPLVLALYALYAGLSGRGQVSAVLVLVLFSGGLLLGRLISIGTDGWPGGWGAGFTILEAGALIVGLRLLLRWPR